jgi:hypothetical protein
MILKASFYTTKLLQRKILHSFAFSVSKLEKIIYLEKQFFEANRFSNLEDFVTLQNWLSKQESICNVYNDVLRNRSIKFYSKMKKHKFELDSVREKITIEAVNLKNFPERAEELKNRIQLQKKNLLEFQGKLTKHEKILDSSFLFEKMRFMVEKNGLLDKFEFQTVNGLENKNNLWCCEPIRENCFFSEINKPDKSSYQKMRIFENFTRIKNEIDINLKEIDDSCNNQDDDSNPIIRTPRGFYSFQINKNHFNRIVTWSKGKTKTITINIFNDRYTVKTRNYQ